MQEVWQTTNQQPWVYALSRGLIKLKTRTSVPHVPVGAIVLLHASKSRMWPGWKNLCWTGNMDEKDFVRGAIEAVGIVEAVGLTQDLMTQQEEKYWRVYENESVWSCAAQYTVRFSKIISLEKPVVTRGFQAPFCRAKSKVVTKLAMMNCLNKEINELFRKPHLVAA